MLLRYGHHDLRVPFLVNVLQNGGTGTLAKSISCIAMGGWIHIVGLLGEVRCILSSFYPMYQNLTACSPIQRSSSADIAFQAIMKTCVLRGVFVGPASLYVSIYCLEVSI